MLERAFKGSKRYWIWMGFLGLLMAGALCTFIYQMQVGLGITGLSRDVPWGFYIAQFTFMVGVAASAVMVVLPYYYHNYKVFGKVTLLGEFVAISSIIVCLLFIVVDMGNPVRLMNALLHPTPWSMIFWDIVVLNSYLVVNIIITRVTFDAERKSIAPPKWIKPLIIFSVPLAVSIHTVTAFLYSGLAARSFWETAILAPRFLASAFAAGPSLLIIIVLLVRKLTKYDVGKEPIQTLGKVIAYAMTANVFFIGLEIFTALYTGKPEHAHHFQYLYFGLHGHSGLVPFGWTSAVLTLIAFVGLLIPKLRENESILVALCATTIVALWIDKGINLVITGFVPNPTGHVVEYSPTAPELFLSLGIFAAGAFVLTGLYKIAISTREDMEDYGEVDLNAPGH